MTLTPHLKAGDLIDVVAPGSAAPVDALDRGIQVLKSWGLQVRVPENLLQPHTFFANSDPERLKCLKTALSVRDSKAVWFVRGGSGTHRLLPALFKFAKPKSQKLIIGFSDATSLLVGANKHWKWPTLHGPVLTQLGRGQLDPADIEELRKLLFGEIAEVKFTGLKPLNAAAQKLKARLLGEIVGGNLTVYQNLIGVPEAAKVKNKIVFFEEINERGYRIDRTLTHLLQARFFDGVKAVVLGDFLGGDEPTSTTLYSSAVGASQVNRVHWALENFGRDLKSIPLFAGLAVGHGTRNRPVPFGTLAEIKAGVLTVRSPLATSRPSPLGSVVRAKSSKGSKK